MIARAEDASKISRIAERFKLASEATASVVTDVEKAKDEKAGQPEPDIGVQDKAEKDKLLDALMGTPIQRRKMPQTPRWQRPKNPLCPSLPQSSQRNPQRGLL